MPYTNFKNIIYVACVSELPDIHIWNAILITQSCSSHKHYAHKRQDEELWTDIQEERMTLLKWLTYSCILNKSSINFYDIYL